MNKKSKEYKILRLIYSESKFPVSMPSERPDFILGEGLNKFGVEVTEYYHSESSARLKNIPDYFNQLLNKTFIHPKDVGILEVIDDISIQDESTGEWKPMSDKGVLQMNPHPLKIIDELKKIVALKNMKFANYDKSLSKIDLIIYDGGDLISGSDGQKEFVISFLKKQEKANTLVTPFKNVFLVIKESKEKNLIIKLKTSSL